jgi:hypothetical protein
MKTAHAEIGGWYGVSEVCFRSMQRKCRSFDSAEKRFAQDDRLAWRFGMKVLLSEH